MKKLYTLVIAIFAFATINAQCEFPRNTGTNQYQNAIHYNGEIYQTNLPNGRVVFRVDPSRLGLNKHEITNDSLHQSETGEWFFKWNYAGSPNRWQPMIFDCDAAAVSIQTLDGNPLTTGQIEVDFFYLDKANKISATFRGSIVFDVKRGVFTGDKLSYRTASF